MRYNVTNLVVHPNPSPESSLLLRITPELAGWDYITFESHRLIAGKSIEGNTGNNEMALMMLGGTVDVQSSAGDWRGIGKRSNVFEGRPHALYLSRNTRYTISATSDAELVLAWAPVEQDFPAKRIQPEDCAVEIRGGDNATRQINSIIPPGFACQRLVVVEVYTPGGNWSSYPPHKHDVHRVDGNSIIEADLEEVYFYKIDKPEGYAYQRIYTDDASPMQQAGEPIDAVVMASAGDAVIVPEGYHPVASPPGYTTYYLNVLAGSAQSLANYEDPNYAWVKQTYKGRDARVPVYHI